MEVTTVQRKTRDGTRNTIDCPQSVYLYIKYMGGVDHNDQLRQYYNVRLKGRKYYKYIWWFLFHVAITNAYIPGKNYTDLSIPSLKSFCLDLAKGLIGEYTSRKRAGHPPITPPSQKVCEEHFPKRVETHLCCYYCYHHMGK